MVMYDLDWVHHCFRWCCRAAFVSQEQPLFPVDNESAAGDLHHRAVSVCETPSLCRIFGASVRADRRAVPELDDRPFVFGLDVVLGRSTGDGRRGRDSLEQRL